MYAEIKKDRIGEYRWTLFAANHRKIADSGEGYTHKVDCTAGLNAVLNITSLTYFHFYQDAANEWRWRVKAQNGRILADSGEGYKNYSDCEGMAKQIVVATPASVTVYDRAA